MPPNHRIPPNRVEPIPQLFFRQMKPAGDSAEQLLFAKQRRRRCSAAGRPKLRERSEQLLGRLRGTMSIRECVQSVGHYFEFVFQCVHRRGEERAELVASMRSNKITR